MDMLKQKKMREKSNIRFQINLSFKEIFKILKNSNKSKYIFLSFIYCCSSENINRGITLNNFTIVSFYFHRSMLTY